MYWKVDSERNWGRISVAGVCLPFAVAGVPAASEAELYRVRWEAWCTLWTQHGDNKRTSRGLRIDGGWTGATIGKGLI